MSTNERKARSTRNPPPGYTVGRFNNPQRPGCCGVPLTYSDMQEVLSRQFVAVRDTQRALARLNNGERGGGVFGTLSGCLDALDAEYGPATPEPAPFSIPEPAGPRIPIDQNNATYVALPYECRVRLFNVASFLRKHDGVEQVRINADNGTVEFATPLAEGGEPAGYEYFAVKSIREAREVLGY